MTAISAAQTETRPEPCPFSGFPSAACPSVPYIPEGRIEDAHRRWHDLMDGARDGA